MSFFHKSSEDYIKQIIRIALKLKDRIENENDYSYAIKILKKITEVDEKLYNKIEEETRSKSLMRQSLYIKNLAANALVDAAKGNFNSMKGTISLIIASGEKYLNSEEKFVGYKIEEYIFSLKKQAKFLSDFIEPITTLQATLMLEISFNNGLDLIIGGSSFRNNKIGGDLDVGFKISESYKNKIDVKDLRLIVTKVVNKINKECFKEFLKLKKPLMAHKWIHDASALTGIENIDTVERFFMRVGFRYEPHIMLKNGKPFGPSGFVNFESNGQTTIITPIIKKGTIVGETKFW